MLTRSVTTNPLQSLLPLEVGSKTSVSGRCADAWGAIDGGGYFLHPVATVFKSSWALGVMAELSFLNVPNCGTLSWFWSHAKLMKEL